MPCKGPDCDEDRAYEVKDLRDQVNRLTDLLCKQCGLLDRAKLGKHIHPELTQWWSSHQEHDKRRLANEQRQRLESVRYKKQQMKELAKEIAELEDSE